MDSGLQRFFSELASRPHFLQKNCGEETSDRKNSRSSFIASRFATLHMVNFLISDMTIDLREKVGIMNFPPQIEIQ
jgi:hypothetical protein